MRGDTLDIVVIGLGNPHRGDDAVGPEVANMLSQQDHPFLRVCTSMPDATSLLDCWQGADLCFVVDCSVSGSREGAVQRINGLAGGIPERFLNSTSTHTLSVAQGLELGRVLDRLPHRLIIYGIEGVQFSHGAPMSPAVRDAVDRVAAAIIKEIEEITNEVAVE
ncbi:MAG: hydrogenase maturation protease [candidate division Zixibacteria bacterium]|nr:hydrogenase maturation protease [candidate division Zixibacteria bacterium]MBU1470857.1 hydrogenase maturation protease [candidate division Zixibacteria bacterium]MBU2625723.1 hydrogenase maturation protease [candidate division Zixibacteria bacterium]